MIDPRRQLQAMKNRAAGVRGSGNDFTRIRMLQSTIPGFDRTVWRELCSRTDLNPRGRQFRVVVTRLGAELAPEPLIAAAMAASLLPQQHRAAVLAGERIILPAWQEDTNSLDPVGQTVLRGGKLTGRKCFIAMAAGADAFLVTTADGLALVERDSPGVSLDIRRTADGGHIGMLRLQDAAAEPLEGDAREALEHATLAHSFYLFGLTERALKLAFDPTADASGVFATLRNREADMRIQVALTREVINAAANSLDSNASLEERQSAVSRAKIRASDAAIIVTRTCVQLHTGTGSMSLGDLGLFQRKAVVQAAQYGTGAAHRARLTQ